MKVKPQWLLVAHHELPEHYYTKNGKLTLRKHWKVSHLFFAECPQYVARMFTIDLYTVFRKSTKID